MLRHTIFASLIASSALTLAIATPAAAASKTDRAREAIAAAEARIHTAETMGAGTDAPREYRRGPRRPGARQGGFRQRPRGPGD